MVHRIVLLAALTLLACRGVSGGCAPHGFGTEAKTTPEGDRPAQPNAAVSDRVRLPYALHLLDGQDPRLAREKVEAAARKAFPDAAIVAVDQLDDEARLPALAVTDEEMAPLDEPFLRHLGRGLEDHEIQAFTHAHRAVVLRVSTDRAHLAAVLKSATALVGDTALALQAAVEDWDARAYFPPRGFADDVGRDGFEGDLPIASHHFSIQSYELDNGSVRSVTVGLSKLGLPNIVVNGHSRGSTRAIGNLINATAQMLLENPDQKAAGRLELDLHRIRAKSVGERNLAALKKGGTGKALVTLAPGERDEGDDPGPLVEITFEGAGSATERQEALLDGLFGAEDGVKDVNHTAEILAASARARERLIQVVKPAWLGKHAPGDDLLVKGPFRTQDDGREWMWVEVTSWKGGTIRGTLQNKPERVPELKAGAQVELQESDVFDYIHRTADGREEGNETAKYLDAQ